MKTNKNNSPKKRSIFGFQVQNLRMDWLHKAGLHHHLVCCLCRNIFVWGLVKTGRLRQRCLIIKKYWCAGWIVLWIPTSGRDVRRGLCKKSGLLDFLWLNFNQTWSRDRAGAEFFSILRQGIFSQKNSRICFFFNVLLSYLEGWSLWACEILCKSTKSNKDFEAKLTEFPSCVLPGFNKWAAGRQRGLCEVPPQWKRLYLMWLIQNITSSHGSCLLQCHLFLVFWFVFLMENGSLNNGMSLQWIMYQHQTAQPTGIQKEKTKPYYLFFCF